MFNRENRLNIETGGYLTRLEIEQATIGAQQHFEDVKRFAEEVKAKRDNWLTEGHNEDAEGLSLSITEIEKSVEDAAGNCDGFKKLLEKYDNMEHEHAEEIDKINAEEAALRKRLAELEAQEAEYDRQIEEIKHSF